MLMLVLIPLKPSLDMLLLTHNIPPPLQKRSVLVKDASTYFRRRPQLFTALYQSLAGELACLALRRTYSSATNFHKQLFTLKAFDVALYY
ncbi:hypothetical protein EVAR_101040_1 [Eumeta japonica]|uniref:Uncharacterized protein n=1 Tax=Eumeta variegata TaxID=151549 RepID=A0A4C1TNG6_EUMVA|nr:hypothetical protein EVAR_101040_1 [Eumeta japonica]